MEVAPVDGVKELREFLGGAVADSNPPSLLELEPRRVEVKGAGKGEQRRDGLAEVEDVSVHDDVRTAVSVDVCPLSLAGEDG